MRRNDPEPEPEELPLELLPEELPLLLPELDEPDDELLLPELDEPEELLLPELDDPEELLEPDDELDPEELDELFPEPEPELEPEELDELLPEPELDPLEDEEPRNSWAHRIWWPNSSHIWTFSTPYGMRNVFRPGRMGQRISEHSGRTMSSLY